MVAELLVVVAGPRHAITQQPVAFPRIPPGLDSEPECHRFSPDHHEVCEDQDSTQLNGSLSES